MVKELKNVSMRQATGLKDNLPTSGPDGQLYIARKDGAPSELWCGTGNGIEKLGESKSSGLEVGDIGMSLYVDESKGLRRYLNGQIVDINTNTQAFLNRLKEITTLHPSLLCTEDEWQTAKTMSAFGQVGKFVFNYSGSEIVSVRIPRVVNIQGLFDLQNLGMTVSAGLPTMTTSETGNHTHTRGTMDIQGRFSVGGGNYIRILNTAGAFSPTDNSGNVDQGGSSVGTYDRTALFQASKNWTGATSETGSHTHKVSFGANTTTVQPEAIQYPYFIQIATGSETENNIINEIELNNPYSLFDSKYSDHELNNLSWLKSEGQWNAKAVYPDAYDKLLKVYNGTETVEGLSVKLSTETYTDYDFVLNTADETFRLPLKTLHTDDTVASLSLYFYVGETVQNANLIDAGRISEVVSNKLDKKQLYNKITNCLLEVPQRIKLELNDGTLTLKAGSQVIVPNGFEADGTTPKFDYVDITSDRILDISVSLIASLKYVYIIQDSVYPRYFNTGQCFSGATAPTGGTYLLWYDTTNNLIKESQDGGATWTGRKVSFPVCLFSANGNQVTSIDQVFNGMGYIGNTIFCDKGVKGLIPNGFNIDGTLNNIEFTTSGILTATRNISGNNLNLGLSRNNFLNFISNNYRQDLNINVNGKGLNTHSAIVGTWSADSTGRITSFQPKLIFRAVDYNDFRSEVDGKADVDFSNVDNTAKILMSGMGMPSGIYKNLTLPSSGSTITAPADGWVCFGKKATNAGQFVKISAEQTSTLIVSANNGNQLFAYLPVKSGATCTVEYNAGGTTEKFCFVYAEGSKSLST